MKNNWIPSYKQWRKWSLPSKYTAVALVLGFISFSWYLVDKYVFEPDLPIDYEDSNRPYLEPELVIYKIDSTGIHYKYILKNTGVLPAKDLMFSQRTENGILGEFEAKQRDLAPKGELEVKNALMLSISSIQLKNISNFVLIASHNTNIGNQVKKYYSSFRFSIPLNEIKVGSFKYNDVRRKEGQFSQDKFMEYLQKEFPKIQTKRKIRPDEIIDAHSYFTLLKLKDTSLNRNKYILDAGKFINKDRVSLYVNNKNDLVFRIIDKNKQVDSVFIRNQPNLFKYSWLVNCEYAYGRDFALLRLFVGDSLGMEKKILHKAELSSAKGFVQNLTMGSDMTNENGGVFVMAFFATFGKLLEENERGNIVKEYKNKEIRKWVRFNGISSLNTKGNNN